ncbi:MAG: fimbrillin family protein, partial [Alistipes sp.]|nr:fimbrillin family protein [Alistipes sp.]
MKKLLVIALAAIGVVACVKEEVALMPKGGAISFENAFISNSTRGAVDPSTTTETLDGFNV